MSFRLLTRLYASGFRHDPHKYERIIAFTVEEGEKEKNVY